MRSSYGGYAQTTLDSGVCMKSNNFSIYRMISTILNIKRAQIISVELALHGHRCIITEDSLSITLLPFLDIKYFVERPVIQLEKDRVL